MTNTLLIDDLADPHVVHVIKCTAGVGGMRSWWAGEQRGGQQGDLR